MTELLRSIPLLEWWATPLAVLATGLVVVARWWRTTRHLRVRTQLAVVASGVVLGVLAWLAVDVVWHPFAEGMGRYVWWWVAVIAVVVVQALARPRGGRRDGHRGRRVAARASGVLASVVVVVLAALLAINAHLSAFPTLAAALGVGYEPTPLQDLEGARRDPVPTGRPAGPLVASWQPPVDMPLTGRVVTQDIPSSDPRFTPRPALAYLPPAYLTQRRPLLPVLVLLSGQPGDPSNWTTAGRLQQTMDAYAAAHHGLAPVVVVPDPLGSSTANPLCADAHLGNVATYLQVDVPAWITTHLQVDTDRSRWAIAGLSNGGTCALQVVTRDPRGFPTFLDMSGELHPTLGSEAATITQGFGGDRAAYEANDPLTLLGRNRYEGVHGLFSAGVDDQQFLPGMRQVEAAARASGMVTELRTYPGGHAWTLWATVLADQVGWLGDRLGITC